MVKTATYLAHAILFDWDGTLLDSYQADARAYLAMFRALGISWSLDDLERHYSPNWTRVYAAAGVPRSLWKRGDRLWTAAYRNENPALLPGARHVLESLARKFKLGIVSSGNRTRVRRQIREFRLARHFSVCICNEDVAEKKPHPAPLRAALEKLRARPADCLYVGDTPEDIEMARRAGVRAIGVLGPFPSARRIRAARPDSLLESIRELPRVLRALDEKSSE
ncbi:MAG: HAD family hydrolase [Candidatus Acidiferrales bacterium]